MLIDLVVWAVQMHEADVRIERVQYMRSFESRRVVTWESRTTEPAAKVRPGLSPTQRAELKEAVEWFVRDRPGALINLKSGESPVGGGR